MKKKFSVGQIVSALKQAEVGVPIAGLIRKVGITEQTFRLPQGRPSYRWKSKLARATHRYEGHQEKWIELRMCMGDRADPGA